ncbi:MAG: peptidoglycan bridge formation glycyltransferase FemA/FemB family protein [Arcobacter sp.]|nr:peptidoglycan bridge formation glycyltransferase FemA/FemB family protein [Arcobacter sp.]
MKFTYAPLPSWKSLLSIILPGRVDDFTLANTWIRKKSEEQSIWLSRTSWSIVIIALLRQKLKNIKPVNIWFPDYFCNSSLDPLRSFGINPFFYPIDSNREPDYKKCKELAKDKKVDIFVLVHYFGKPANVNSASNFCLSKQAWLVEDAAHVLKPINGVGEKGDFVLYSPHKHLPLYDGALLVIRKNGISKQDISLKYIQEIKEQCKKKCQVNDTHIKEILKWISKKILQKCGIRKKLKITFHDSNETPLSLLPPEMTSCSKKILDEYIKQIDLIAIMRKRNRKIWNYIFEKLSSEHSVIFQVTEQDDFIPYLNGYYVEDNKIEEYFERFLELDLPVNTWPDLPIEVREEKDLYKNAIILRKENFFITTHHTLKFRKLAKRIISSADLNKVKVTWNELSKDKWDLLFNQIQKSNLLQAWDYGEAKKAIERWEVSRGVFYINEEPIALIQIIHKKYFGFKIMRINRGPLFIKQVDDSVVAEIVELISREAGFLKRTFLLWNPEFYICGYSDLLLDKYNYIKRNILPWSSSWIDLSIHLEEIRKRLDGKWRNMLNASEKMELCLEEDWSCSNWELLKEKYNESMQEKKFKGISVSLIDSIKNQSKLQKSFLILKAKNKDEFVAMICVALHGNSATYLIGWNGDVGRKLKANQFLLWNSIVILKKNGFRWFDLGGIDEINTPSIAEFKLGVNGKRYELTGEYFKV